MEKHEISNSKIDWVSLIRHVARDQVTVEIADGSTAIAEVVPKKKPFAVKDLPALMASLPALGDDALSFANDVEKGRNGFQLDDDPWEFDRTLKIGRCRHKPSGTGQGGAE